MKTLPRWIVVLALALALPATVLAAAGAAGQPSKTIQGTVRGPSGEVIAGAQVSLVPGSGPQGESTTDAKGHYQLTWAPATLGLNVDYSLLARSQTRQLAALHGVDETTTNLDLTLQPALTLVAKVQDVQGKPITNAIASVTLIAGNAGSRVNPQPTPADDQGRVQIETLPQGQRYSIRLSAEGYGTANQQVEATETRITRLELPGSFLAVANLKLGGQVFGADGKPAGGAAVRVSGSGQPASSTKTDDSGHFIFEGVCAGDLTVFATLAGNSGRLQTSGGDTNIVLNLSAPAQNMAIAPNGSRLTGKITDASGAPVGGARVAIYSAVYANASSDDNRSDAEGNYSVSLQNTQVMFQPNFTPAIIARSLARNLAAYHNLTRQDTKVDLQLQPGITFSGVVQDTKGTPLGGAVVRFQIKMGNNNATSLQNDTPANPDGTFSIPALPQGMDYFLQASCPGYGMATITISAADSRTASFTVPAIKLKLADRRIEGTVVDLRDKPVSGAMVFLTGLGQPDANTRSDANGHFAFPQVCEGAAIVMAYRTDGGAVVPAHTQAQGGDMNIVVKLGATPQRQVQTRGMQQVNAPARFFPLQRPYWAWDSIAAWPGQHRKFMLILLGVQVLAVFVTAAGILWVARDRHP